jgi:hypothetical protein
MRVFTAGGAALIGLVLILPWTRSSPAVAAQQASMRTLIEQALDQPVDFELKDQPLSAAFEQIGTRTGIKLTIRPQVVDLLPYGRDTRVNATIKNVSLRAGLAGMLDHLGMIMMVQDDAVAIEPKPPLRRICRRATWSELKLLYQLSTTAWTPDFGAKLPCQYQIKTSGDPKEQLLAEAAKVGSGMAADVLEAACRHLGWSWYPWDNLVVILPIEEQAERFIDRSVTLKFSNMPLMDVLTDLARQADLRLRLEPGVIRDLPLQMQQNLTLQMRDTTIRQGLEMIAGVTGLAYEVTNEEIVIRRSKALTSAAASSQPISVYRPDDPIVGQVSVSGKSGFINIMLYVRESDLTAKANKFRRDKIKQAVQKMEQELAP